MVPALEAIAEEVEGRLQAVRIDVSVYSPIADRFQVCIIPTLFLYTRSGPVAFVVGLVPSRFIYQTMSGVS